MSVFGPYQPIAFVAEFFATDARYDYPLYGRCVRWCAENGNRRVEQWSTVSPHLAEIAEREINALTADLEAKGYRVERLDGTFNSNRSRASYREWYVPNETEKAA